MSVNRASIVRARQIDRDDSRGRARL